MAVKMIQKKHLDKEQKRQYAKTERDILSMCDHPLIIKLYTTFQDPAYLCTSSSRPTIPKRTNRRAKHTPKPIFRLCRPSYHTLTTFALGYPLFSLLSTDYALELAPNGELHGLVRKVRLSTVPTGSRSRFWIN
jgi:serine/threonine protein kinase